MAGWMMLKEQNLKTSKEGIELIKKFEGFRAKPYICAGGKLTIGYGHTKYTARYTQITELEGEKLLKEDIKDAESAVRELVKVELNQNQLSALVSFVFNVGAGNFKRSTLLKRLNAKDYTGAAQELNKWVYSAGKKLKGLVIRRLEERALFLKDS